ncbi:MAG: hypothetical protein FJ213_03185 [Ignavibacteria bacterium]|nr:hypothetical protein [Ignavibacteria bacterium]
MKDINRYSFILLILSLLFHNSTFSQDRDLRNKIPSMDELLQKASLPKTGTAATPLEGAIDPETYIIGPGDEFTIGIWGAMGITYSINVNPEGSLIIPTVGVVKVTDLNLAEVKKKVSEKIKQKYLTSEVSVTLTSPRNFLVQVSGVVSNQSAFKVSSVDRVDKAIIMANLTTISAANTLLINPSKENERELALDLQKLDPNKISDIYKRISTRKVILHRKDGTNVNVDLPMFYATGEDKHNPYLREGDRIFVPLKNLFFDFISVYGEVNKSDVYEFVEGDDLEKALLIGGNFTTMANKQKIYLYRLNQSIKKRDELVLKFPENKDFKLERGDQIYVTSSEDKPNNFIVYLSGQIKNTGAFPILQNDTKLSQVISAAGGFTSEADLGSALIIRASESVGEFIDEDFELIQNLRSATAKSLDSLYLIRELKLKRRIVNVDFVKLFREKKSELDITLKNGDIIHVPPVNQNVYVFGQIKNPGYQPYRDNIGFNDYVSLAGGFSENADKSEVKVIKARTYQWLDPDETEIQAGDAIWVPREPERPFLYYFSIARDGLGIIASLATIYLLINQLK